MPSRSEENGSKLLNVQENLYNPKENQGNIKRWEEKHFSTNRKGNQQRLQK